MASWVFVGFSYLISSFLPHHLSTPNPGYATPWSMRDRRGLRSPRRPSWRLEKKDEKKTKCEKPRRLYQHLNKGGLRIFWFTYAVLKDSKSLKKEKHPTIIQSKWFLLKGTQDFSLFFSFTSHLPDCSNLAFAKPSQVQREIVRGFRDPHGPDMFKGREEGGVKSGAKNAKKHL